MNQIIQKIKKNITVIRKKTTIQLECWSQKLFFMLQNI